MLVGTDPRAGGGWGRSRERGRESGIERIEGEETGGEREMMMMIMIMMMLLIIKYFNRRKNGV